MSNMEATDTSTRQLTIRLPETTIGELENLAVSMQKTAPEGMEYTRTDALRTAIIKGIEAMKRKDKKTATGKKSR